MNPLVAQEIKHHLKWHKGMGEKTARLIGGILVKMRQGYILANVSAKRIPRVNVNRGVSGYDRLPRKWRWVHDQTMRVHPFGRGVGERIMTTMHRLQKVGLVAFVEGAWRVTESGVSASQVFYFNGLHNANDEASPVGMGVGKHEIPHPYAQIDCPKDRTAKGRWSKGWVAAWRGLDRTCPYKIQSKDWFRGYDAGKRACNGM